MDTFGGWKYASEKSADHLISDTKKSEVPEIYNLDPTYGEIEEAARQVY